MIRSRLACLFLVSSLLVAGCAGHPVAAPALPAGTTQLAIVTPGTMPAMEMRGLAGSKVQGAAIGGGATWLGCVGALGASTCAGPVCGPMIALWAGVCGVAGVAGAGAGAALTPSAASQRNDAAAAARAGDALQSALQPSLAGAAVARGYGIDGDPAGLRIEAGVTRLGARAARRSGFGGPLTAFMEARAKLVDADGRELAQAELSWTGDTRERDAWLADGAAPLREALSRGFDALGAQVVDQLLAYYPLPDRHAHADGLAAQFGLRAIEPPTHLPLTGERILGRQIEWTTTPSTRPLLRWETFPRESDRATAPDDMARVTDVRYDLVVARAHGDTPAEIVYRREGLRANEDRPQAELVPGTRYFWTVRARFVLDGRERVTDWSATDYRAFGSTAAPSEFSFRFRVGE